MNSKINILSRREFLARNTQLAAVAALSALTDIPTVMQRAMAEGSIGQPGPSGRPRKVLFIFLRGANDGLNALIPVSDPAYLASRDTIGIRNNPDSAWNYNSPGSALWTPSGANATFGEFALPMGNGFAGLHPALKFLVPVYNAGNLAMIHRVGYPKQSQSHFDSQNYWETGIPGDMTAKEGLLYRAMVESGLAGSAPLSAVSFQNSLPLILRGSRAALTNVPDPTRYGLLGIPDSAAGAEKAKQFLELANKIELAPKRDRELLRLQYDNLSQTLGIFKQIDFTESANTFRDNEITDEDTQWASENGDQGYYLFPTTNAKNGGWARKAGNRAEKYIVPTGAYGFFNNLKSAALILNKTDAVVAGTQIDGWDTHSSQGAATGSHSNLLKQVGWAMYALQKYFSRYSELCHWEDLTIVTLSEFGRTSKENDNDGTDHAEASVMWVTGGGIKGFKAGDLGTVSRSGVLNCGPSDPIPWQTGLTGSMFQGGDKRYLLRATDYRSVLGKVIRDHLGATQDQLNRIIPGYANESKERLLAGGTQSTDGKKVTGEPDI